MELSGTRDRLGPPDRRAGEPRKRPRGVKKKKVSYYRPTGRLDPAPAELAYGSLELAALEYQAHRGEIILLYEDETILWRFALPRAGWWRTAQRARLPIRPLSQSQIKREEALKRQAWLQYRSWSRVTSGVLLSVLGAVQYGTSKVFYKVVPQFDTEGFRQYIHQVMARFHHTGKPVVMVADRSGIHRAPTLAEAQKVQLGFIVALLRPRSAYLAEYIHLRDRLEIAAVKGRNEPRIAAVRPKEGPVGEAFAENKLVRDADLIAVPLQGATGPLGALVLISPRVDAPDALLEALAAQAAAAWEFARLREDTARREKDLQTALAGLKSMEKNREELLANVSHDLKTPLTTVKAYLAMLGQGRMGEVPEKQLHAIHVAERNADRLLRMLNDVLLLSRLQTGKMQLTSRPFGLRALVSDVMSALASSGELSRVRPPVGLRFPGSRTIGLEKARQSRAAAGVTGAAGAAPSSLARSRQERGTPCHPPVFRSSRRPSWAPASCCSLHPRSPRAWSPERPARLTSRRSARVSSPVTAGSSRVSRGRRTSSPTSARTT